MIIKYKMLFSYINNLYDLATKDSVDIEVLVDDFVTFYVAGQEITSNLLSFALILTLQHPHVLERYIPCSCWLFGMHS